MDSPRAVTKILLPGKRGTLLHRPRLTNFLLEHIERKLLLVSASAGYGKTSLLVDFAHETTLPVCWYSLDPSDSDPHTFLEYIVFSLQRRFPEFGKRTMALLSSTPLARDLDAVVGTLVTEIYEEISDYFILVIDDYQTVEDSEPVNRILDTLLRLLPENAHIVLSGRTMPSRITITRLAAHQEIAGLGVTDLRFTASEIKELVEQTYRLTISDGQATELAQHSEGWITGILLTTHSLWSGLLKDLVRLEGTQVNVFNYLASEVFNQQTHQLQRFLLESSILPHMNAPLCDSVLGMTNASDLLLQLEQRNLFITRIEEDVAWYRYHHLFREYLHSQLKMQEPSRWQSLHVAAANYLASSGSVDQAIPHFIEAGAFSEAARAIQEIAKEQFDAGRWTTLDGWIESLPEAVLDRNPKLIVWKARILGEMGQHDAAQAHFQRAMAIYEKNQDHNEIGEVLVKQAVFLRYQGKYALAVQDCVRALQLLAPTELAVVAEAHRTIGSAASLAGDLDRGVQELEVALHKCEEANDLTNAARVHHDLGVAFRTAGRREAEQHFLQALEFWRRAKNASGLAYTLNSIGVTYHHKGNFEQAVETLEEALKWSRECGQLRIEAVALASLGDVYRDQREFERAEQAYRSAFVIAQQINESFITTYVLISLGTVFRLNGQVQAANKLIQDGVSLAISHHSNYEIGLAKTELGTILHKQGRSDAAVEELSQASDSLERAGAKSDCARAHLQISRVFFDRKQLRKARQHLKIAANLGSQSEERHFLVCEGQEIVPLVKFAISRKIGDGYFENALSLITHSPPAQSRGRNAADEEKSKQIRVWGLAAAAVQVGDRLVTRADWDSSAARELFFLLLSNPRGLRKEQVLTALWPDVPPAKANGIFHSTAWRMRRALSRDCIQYHNGLYRVNPSIPLSYDVTEFLDLLDRSKRAHEPNLKAQLITDAIALYHDDFFEESYNDWVIPIRNELLDGYLRALGSLAQIHGEQGNREAAIETYERLLAKDSYREDVYQRVITLYMELGNRTGALRAYERCRQSMAEANVGLSRDMERMAGTFGAD